MILCNLYQQPNGYYYCTQCDGLRLNGHYKRRCKVNGKEPKPDVSVLGYVIEEALSSIEIPSGRMSEWINAPGGCGHRKERLRQISRWAAGVMKGGASAENLACIIPDEQVRNRLYTT